MLTKMSSNGIQWIHVPTYTRIYVYETPKYARLMTQTVSYIIDHF